MWRGQVSISKKNLFRTIKTHMQMKQRTHTFIYAVLLKYQGIRRVYIRRVTRIEAGEIHENLDIYFVNTIRYLRVKWS